MESTTRKQITVQKTDQFGVRPVRAPIFGHCAPPPLAENNSGNLSTPVLGSIAFYSKGFGIFALCFWSQDLRCEARAVALRWR